MDIKLANSSLNINTIKNEKIYFTFICTYVVKELK